MPNLQQIQAIVHAYSPIMYLHPDEEYQPSPVNRFFANGGLLYKKGYESHPTPIQPNGTNLPQDPNNDGSYRLDLPANEDIQQGKSSKGRVTKLKSIYAHKTHVWWNIHIHSLLAILPIQWTSKRKSRVHHHFTGENWRTRGGLGTCDTE
ncbi:hypothetical protein K1719_039900 [Acacia pycnantha]|nr:hypothetical protein K1719_039900 [Acacia pycnantha]